MFPPAAPLSLTPLIGRDDELARLTGLILETRLLTLTGSGGSGKTRLASEVAECVASRFGDGIAWVELAPLADATLLPTYLLGVLAIEHGARPPASALLETLRAKDLLLVLDNCEHLVDACATLAESLLLGCPRLRILATSREALGIGGEQAWLVPGLALPAASADDAQSVEHSAAARLFVDRAQAADASFHLTPANVGAIAQICRRLDGLPLAIELAAARVRALPPEELASRLDDAFKILGTGTRTVTPRHRTLREAIEWSYNLLYERERLLLQRLSVFVGDFTLDAAESVGADADLDSADVLDTIGALVDKSLVTMRETAGTARFFLLETIRQYASACLKDSGGDCFQSVCARHARTYVDFVAKAAPRFITRERPLWVQRVHRELDNVRVALAFTRDNAVGDHLRLAGDLGWFWYSSGLWAEGRRWSEGALSLPWTPDMGGARARVLLAAGVIASLQSAPATSGPWLIEAEQLFRLAGDESGEAYAQAYQGITFGQVSDERAVAPTRRALEWFRRTGDLYGLRLCLVVLATYHATRGDSDVARELAAEGVDVARAFGLDRELAIAVQIHATGSLARGDYEGADALVRESLAALRRDPSLLWSARALQLKAIVNFHGGHARRGAELMGAAEVIRESIGAGLFGGDRLLLEPALEKGKSALGVKEFEDAWKHGRTQSLEQVMERELSEQRPASGVIRRDAPDVTTPAASLSLDVTTLGPLRILRDGEPLPGDAWRYARPRELLLYLLAHPDGRTRDQIGLVFWPDASSTQVKNNFHVMLHHVRKAVGRPDLIAFERDRYRIAWELGVRCDAREFEEQMRAATRALKSARTDADCGAASLRDALALYRGDFLADAGALDWHLEIRDRLRLVYSQGQLLLGDRTLELGSYKEAADAFRRAIAVDELHEPAHRRLMLTLARAGQRSEALRHYDRLARALRKDLEAEPESETRQLFERLRRANPV